jgi:hypothetical protein
MLIKLMGRTAVFIKYELMDLATAVHFDVDVGAQHIYPSSTKLINPPMNQYLDLQTTHRFIRV